MKTMKKKVKSSQPVALITGAASSLGSEISRTLVKKGMRIVLHYGDSLEKTLNFQNELNNIGAETFLAQADLKEPTQIKKLIEKIDRKWGRLDVLVNSASIFKPTPPDIISWQDWNEIFTLNTFSPAFLATVAKSLLKKNKGCVINITDIYGEVPALENHSIYSTSKAALVFLTKYLAMEMGPEIRVNAVSPGVVSFPPNYSAKKKKELIEKSTLRRQGTPREIADAVLFLVSNQFVTGQVLKVDGGRFIF